LLSFLIDGLSFTICLCTNSSCHEKVIAKSIDVLIDIFVDRTSIQ